MRGFWVAALAWAFVFGPAYNLYLDYHFTHSTDAASYLDMARGNLDVNPTHRYRVAVPFLAAGVAKAVGPVYGALWDFRADPVWTYRLGFLMVNSLLMAAAGAFIFFGCRAYGAGPTSSLIAMLAVLSSRWANYMAALPLTDSLYFMTLAMAFTGIKTRNAGMVLSATLLGPLAKESFLFVAPILFLGPLGWRKQIAALLVSGLAAFSMRWGIDHSLGEPMWESWRNALAHGEGIGYGFRRLFLHRLGEKFSVLGFFTVIGLAGFMGGKAARQTWLRRIDKACLGLILAVLIHVVLSGDVGRMLFLGAPVWAVALALILEHHPLFAPLRARMTA